MAQMNMIEAIRSGLDVLMDKDPNVVVLEITETAPGRSGVASSEAKLGTPSISSARGLIG